MNKIITIAFLCLLLGACTLKTDAEFDTGSEVPVFYLNGTLGSGVLDVQAGINGYYMFTGTIVPDSQQHKVEYGFFARDYCQNLDCTGSLGFEFRSGAGNATELQMGTQDYFIQLANPASTTIYKSKFAASQADVDSIEWLIQGVPVSGDSVLHTTLFSPQEIQVDMNSKRAGIRTGYTMTFSPASVDSCSRISIRATIQDSMVYLSALFDSNYAGNPANAKILWNNGAFNVTQVTMPYHRDSVYKIYTFDEGNGQLGSLCRTFVTLSKLPEEGTVESNSFTTSIKKIHPLEQQGIVITWQDANGHHWSSALSPQLPESFFEINQIAPYELNENNQATKMLSVKFKCLLYSSPVQNQPVPPGTVLWQEIAGEGVIGLGSF